MIFGISCRETQNFWSPERHRKEFRISDPPNNKGENSEFLIPKEYNEGFRISDPQRAQQRIQNFWSPKSTGKDSVFLIPQRFRISDPQQRHTKLRIQNFWSPTKTHKRMLNLWSPTKAQKSIQSFWSPKEHRRRFRISDPPRNMAGKGFRISGLPLNRIPNFLSPKIEHSLNRNQNFPQTTQEKKLFFSLGSKQSQNLGLKSLFKDSGVNWRMFTSSTT